MRFESEPFPRFNLAAMSGVYAGMRADRFYRLRLWQVGLWQQAGESLELRWYQLNILREPGDNAPYALTRYQPQSAPQSTECAAQNAPVDIQDDQTLARLPHKLSELGLGLHACGTCRFWRQTTPATVHEAALGRCSWTWDHDAAIRKQAGPLLVQSALALGCSHWEAAQGDTTMSEPHPEFEEIAPSSQFSDPSAAGTSKQPAQTPGFWNRLFQRSGQREINAGQEPASFLTERSGVGAGTEPCFACHGRLANLGAVVVESPDGDPQTYSVWRCRHCHSTYLNRWIDRWVRTDNLETDETHFRIAPLEAAEALMLIRGTPGADHPKDRNLRGDVSRTLESLAHTSDPISRAVKHGR